MNPLAFGPTLCKNKNRTEGWIMVQLARDIVAFAAMSSFVGSVCAFAYLVG